MVDVAAFDDGDVVGQELKRDDGQERREALFGSWHFDTIIRDLADQFIAFCHDSNYPALAGFDLLDIADDFLVCSAVRRDNHYRHLLRDKRYRSVLHLRRRIAFGMDIRDLLKLKRALEGYGEVISAAEINEVLGIGEDLREVRDPFVFAQHALWESDLIHARW